MSDVLEDWISLAQKVPFLMRLDYTLKQRLRYCSNLNLMSSYKENKLTCTVPVQYCVSCNNVDGRIWLTNVYGTIQIVAAALHPNATSVVRQGIIACFKCKWRAKLVWWLHWEDGAAGFSWWEAGYVVGAGCTDEVIKDCWWKACILPFDVNQRYT